MRLIQQCSDVAPHSISVECRPYSKNWLKISDRLENTKYPRPRYHSMPVIAMQINHTQVAGILNKASLDPARSCIRIVSVQKFRMMKSNVAFERL